MARYYKRSYKNDRDEAGFKIISCCVIFYIVAMIATYNSNPALSGGMLLLGIGIFVFIMFIKKEIIKAQEAKNSKILEAIKIAGLEEYINNFISRFGLGQEKDAKAWTRRNYKISWNRINDLRIFLFQKGIKFSAEEISFLLSSYIDKREFNLTVNSISATNNSFSTLSGSDFEKLLYRLYESMGYSVQLNGKVGDQGGDLVATKDQERVLIQAKCYNNWNIGNSAIQEASAARSHYDCNKAMVIATNEFTKEAVELAKTNNVELISKPLLQKMLLDYLKESWG